MATTTTELKKYSLPKTDMGELPRMLRLIGWLGIIGAFIGGAVMHYTDAMEMAALGSAIVTCVLFYGLAGIIVSLRLIEYNTRRADPAHLSSEDLGKLVTDD